MVPAAWATSSTGSWAPHSSTASPMRAWGRSVTSMASMSMDTRPASGTRWPRTTTGVPDGAWRG